MKVKYAAVKEYVFSVIDCQGNDKEKIKFFFETFYSEYGYNVQRAGLIKAVQDYLQGLPSISNHAFTYCEIEKLLIQWKFLSTKSRQSTIIREQDNYWRYLATTLVSEGSKANVLKSS